MCRKCLCRPILFQKKRAPISSLCRCSCPACSAIRAFISTATPVFSGHAIDRLLASDIERLVVTNSIPVDFGALESRVEVVSVAPLFSAAIKAIHDGDSVSNLFT